MRVLRTLLAAGLTTVLLGSAAASASASPPANPDELTPGLPSGHCLTANHDDPAPFLRSTSTRFELIVYRVGQVTLQEHVELGRYGGHGYPTWDAYVPRKPGHTSTLCMTAGGDLVLRKDAAVVWHTRTAGKAPGGNALLTAGGRLVVRTAGGHVVWSSGTTAVLLVRGDRLTPGSTLVNRTYPGATTRLQMRAGGDLVLQRNHRTVWQSRTHVRGSHAVITANGRLAVVTPAGKAVWASPSEGRYALLQVSQAGRLVLANGQHNQRCWVRPSSSSHDCGAG